MRILREAFSKLALIFSFTCAISPAGALGQVAPEKTKEPTADQVKDKSEEPLNAAQIELLETKYRFETNGDSRKEVHAIVKINSELGVRQFARLNFDYNRSFQSVEIPLAHIAHANGGTSDILPSAITDTPNPAVEKFQAHQDVRVKSVRILGLQPGDSLEYRVITTTTKPPLAPDFYVSHDFANDGLATKEFFEVDLPASRAPQPSTSRAAKEFALERSNEGPNERVIYRWRRAASISENNAGKTNAPPSGTVVDLPIMSDPAADVTFTSFSNWPSLLVAMQKRFDLSMQRSDQLSTKAGELAGGATTPEEKFHALYEFVAQKIATLDLPLGATGYQLRSLEEILSTGYAIPEEKCLVLAALAIQINVQAQPVLVVPSATSSRGPALPSIFTNVLVAATVNGKKIWLDPSTEVAPFGMIAASLRGKPALLLFPSSDIQLFELIPNGLPFTASQRVSVNASLLPDGKLGASVKYILRGDNELLLRVTFHRTPAEKQKEIAQYLALSDGFRGKVTSAKTSDPYDTEKPFEVEYQLTQDKFVDWSKKPVRIPALLPLPGLPEAPKKQLGDAKIELGPPLAIELTGTLRLPTGTTAQAPAGTFVKRDYATFSSEYSAKENILHFSRRLYFLSSELPGARAVDFSAFLHAVQSDQSQLFVLERPDSVPTAKSK